MARIRQIRPEFWTSEQVLKCSGLARLLFIGMWSYCDDRGVMPVSFLSLKAQVFPCDYSMGEIERWMQELIENNLVGVFEEGEREYWYVVGFQKHQLTRHPSYKHPTPPGWVKSGKPKQNYGKTTVGLPEDSSKATEPLPKDSGCNSNSNGNSKSNGKEKNPIRSEIDTPAAPESGDVFSLPSEIDSNERKAKGGKRTESAAETRQRAYEVPSAVNGCVDAQLVSLEYEPELRSLIKAYPKEATPPQVRAPFAEALNTVYRTSGKQPREAAKYLVERATAFASKKNKMGLIPRLASWLTDECFEMSEEGWMANWGTPDAEPKNEYKQEDLIEMLRERRKQRELESK